MRKFVVAGLALSALSAGDARAVEYPWCSSDGGSRQCHYSSREDCIASSGRGFGGLCMQNPSYRGAAEGQASPGTRKASRRKSSKT
jgi:Protein of unknown function (DUF3551)